ncbi:MAG: tetratricopeptide repeat protein, partial [Bifidobacteriales bacterium]|nr:tetratricopeptide repeat protein [Bifidobacteriales bacterium]
DLDSAAFAPPSSTNEDASKENVANEDASADQTDDDGSQNPLSALQSNPTIRTLVSVVFSRELFLSRIRSQGLRDPRDVYRFFDAAMQVDSQGGLKPTEAEFDMRDDRFSPHGSQEEPEFSEVAFADKSAEALGADKAVDLSIQRADLLQRAVGGFHQLASDRTMTSAAKAQAATGIIQGIGDPELEQLAPQVASAMIDGTPVPDFDFSLSSQLDKERVKAR